MVPIVDSNRQAVKRLILNQLSLPILHIGTKYFNIKLKLYFGFYQNKLKGRGTKLKKSLVLKIICYSLFKTTLNLATVVAGTSNCFCCSLNFCSSSSSLSNWRTKNQKAYRIFLTKASVIVSNTASTAPLHLFR